MKTKLLSALMAVITVALLGVASASAAAFDVKVQGHLTRPQMFCASGATLCGTAYIEGYGNTEYGWFLLDTGAPSGACGPNSGLYDYRALVRFTLLSGSTLTLQEVGTVCAPGNSLPIGGLNSYGNPRFFDAHWQVVSATGQFTGLIGNGTNSGTFAGAAVDVRYGGNLTVGSNDATVRLSWEIIGNGAPVTCEEVGASQLRVRLFGIGNPTELSFDCNQQEAEFIVNAGTYFVEIDLVDSAGNPLNQVPVVSIVEIFIGDVYNLGNYQFAFNL